MVLATQSRPHVTLSAHRLEEPSGGPGPNSIVEFINGCSQEKIWAFDERNIDLALSCNGLSNETLAWVTQRKVALAIANFHTISNQQNANIEKLTSDFKARKDTLETLSNTLTNLQRRVEAVVFATQETARTIESKKVDHQQLLQSIQALSVRIKNTLDAYVAITQSAGTETSDEKKRKEEIARRQSENALMRCVIQVVRVCRVAVVGLSFSAIIIGGCKLAAKVIKRG